MKKIISLALVFSLMLSVFSVVPIQAETLDLYKDIVTNFPLTEATGANSKLFVPYKANSDDYKTIWDPAEDVAYVDYISDSAAPMTPNNIHTIPSSYTNAYSLVYTENPDIAKENPYIIYLQDGKYWEINGIKYEINVNDKAVKLRQVEGRAQYDFTNITDTSLQDRYKSLLQVEIDVVEGNYEKVGLLTTMSGGNGKDPTIYVKYKGESAYKQVTVTANTFTYSPKAPSGISEEGYIKFKSLVNTYDSTGYLYSVDEITVDSTKILEKIKIVPTTPYGFFSLISLWGKNPSVKSQIDKVTEPELLNDDNYGKALEELSVFYDYIESLGLSKADLDESMKAKCDDIENPKKTILNNLVNKLPAIDEITAENFDSVKAQYDNIIKYQNDNELEFTAAQTSKITAIKDWIDSESESIAINKILTEIDALPAIENISIENYREIKANIENIKKIMLDYNIDNEKIQPEKLGILEQVESKLIEVSMDITEVIPLDIQRGANAKLWINEDYNDKDYIKFGDYYDKAYFQSTMSGNEEYDPRGFRYSTTSPASDKIIFAPDNLWNMNGINYRIGEDLKAIKVYKNGFTSITDSKIKAIVNSFATATVDLENGIYKNLYLAAFNPYAFAAGQKTSLPYVITYTDETKLEGELMIEYDPGTATGDSSKGYIFDSVPSTGAYGVVRRFGTYEIKTDSQKIVDTITFTGTAMNRALIIGAISGETATIKEMSDKINSMTYSESDISTAGKRKLLDIEEMLKEYKAAGGVESAIVNYDKIMADINTYHENEFTITSSEYYTDFDNVYYRVGFNKKPDVTDAITIKQNEITLDESKYTVEISGNDVLITIPDKGAVRKNYTVSVSTAAKNAADSRFYLDAEFSETFEPLKAVSIDKFEISDNTLNVKISNNQKNVTQNCLAVVLVKNSDNEVLYTKTVKAAIGQNKNIQFAMDIPSAEAGSTAYIFVSNYLEDAKFAILDRVDKLVIE